MKMGFTGEVIAKRLSHLTRLITTTVRKGTNILAGGQHLSSSSGSFSCKSSNDVVSYYKDYEFSCSNSPVNYPRRYSRRRNLRSRLNESAVRLVFDGPYSPEDPVDVNKAADEFIKRFYRDLRLQKSMAVDSPYVV